MDNYIILRCKFCGDKPVIFQSEHSKKWTIHCVNGECESSLVVINELKLNAIAAWNNGYEKQTAKES